MTDKRKNPLPIGCSRNYSQCWRGHSVYPQSGVVRERGLLEGRKKEQVENLDYDEKHDLYEPRLNEAK